MQEDPKRLQRASLLRTFKKMRKVLNSEIVLLRAAAKSGLSGRGSDTIPLLLALSDTAVCIDLLARSGAWNDMTILARAFVERAVNACYLLVCDEMELQGYFQHAKQKAFRLLDRKIGGSAHTISLGFTGTPAPEGIPSLQEALGRYTSSSGKQITHWTKVTIIERINIISQRGKASPVPFLASVLYVYDQASEAIHGTLYGCTFHAGVWDPCSGVQTVDDAAEYNMDSILLLFFLFSLMIDELLALLMAFGDVVGMKAESEKLIKSASKKYDEFLKVLEGSQPSGPDNQGDAEGSKARGWQSCIKPCQQESRKE